MTQAHDYDSIYAQDGFTFKNRKSSPYYPLFQRVIEIAVEKRVRTALDVGCGSGLLTQMLQNAAIVTYGFDFNELAITKAKRRNGPAMHYVGDATDPGAYAGRSYQGIICCEVLEHIPGDLEAIAHWRSGANVIASVPNFDYATHVRYFRHEDEIRERYGALIDIERIERITKKPSAGLTWSQYFRRLRWARERPKELLGMLGVNRFDWYSGWFVIVGKRR